MAREQFTRNCQFFSTTGPNATLVTGTYAQMSGSQTGALEGNFTHDISTLDQTDLLGPGGGPPALSLTMFGQTRSFPLDNVTTAATWLGYILLAITSIVCVMIVIGSDET